MDMKIVAKTTVDSEAIEAGYVASIAKIKVITLENVAKPKREQRAEANLTQINDDEPALLVAELKHYTNITDVRMMLHNTGTVKATTNIGKEIESKIEENIWYLDNGASNHMTGHREKFTKLDESVAGQVKFGDGSVVHIRGKGSIQLLCKNGEERELKDVFFIPTLKSNIISLGQQSYS